MAVESLRLPEKKLYEYIFSICTIVNRKEEYESMKQSFSTNGFAHNCEYLIADNTEKNNFDAYSAINRFLREAKGRYIIIVHQDVICIDHFDKLVTVLDGLEQRDPLWAVCGNGGGNGYKNYFFNMDDNGRLRKSMGLPARVTSLDENLLIIKNDANLTVSNDIKSFHFYGTDICIIADFLGYHCYVIDFMVKHLSSGNLAEMDAFRPYFVERYGRNYVGDSYKRPVLHLH